MKVVEQSCTLMHDNNPQKHIESIGRVCYKSEDNIKDGSDINFIRMLHKNGHTAMLEHYRFIMQIPKVIYDKLIENDVKFITMTEYEHRYIISFNAVALMKLTNVDVDGHGLKGIQEDIIAHIIKRYGCYELFGIDRDNDDVRLMCSMPCEFINNDRGSFVTDAEWYKHGWITSKFITDRGITHELVRHRNNTSFAQESTRYCNYKGGINLINQGFEGREYYYWKIAMVEAENMYLRLLEGGVKPQMARSVLPTCLKTEIVITAPIFEWNHIVDLRFFGKYGIPHPLMIQLMKKFIDATGGIYRW